MKSETPGPKERLTKTAGVFLIENKLHGNQIFFFIFDLPLSFPFCVNDLLAKCRFSLDPPRRAGYRLLNSQLTKNSAEIARKGCFLLPGVHFPAPRISPKHPPRVRAA
jgi:hypothetical protein